jgi:hypothetical protein
MKIYTVTKNKTNTSGYWIDENEKIYIDNIKVINCLTKKKLNKIKTDMFQSGEIAVLYKRESLFFNKKAFIEYCNGKKDILKKKTTFKINGIDNNKIKELCKKHGGFTAYFINKTVKIEIWE